MRVSIPVYFVALLVTFVYGVVKTNFPDVPLNEDDIRWVFDLILGLLGLDVVSALKQNGTLL